MEANPRFWAGKRVCVTGGTGMLGYQLVVQLLRLGAHVRVLALTPPTSHPIHTQKTVFKIFGDVRDAELVRLATARCDVIFHTAGVVSIWRSGRELVRSVHIDGTRNVLQAAHEACVVHTSSLFTFGASRWPEIRSEANTFDLHRLPVSYIHVKRASEQLALDAASHGQNVVVTNPGYLVGPEDYGRSAMGRFCARFWKGRILIIPPGGMNLVDVRDVARGHLLAAEKGRPGSRYALGGENLTFREFVARLAEAGGMFPRPIPVVPWWLMIAVACSSECRARLIRKETFPSFQQLWLSRYYWYCRSDRAEQELGYRSRPLSECLADTYRWYVSCGELGLRGLNRWWMRPSERSETLEQAA
jgi:dihydroflavonol-4-reductase